MIAEKLSAMGMGWAIDFVGTGVPAVLFAGYALGFAWILGVLRAMRGDAFLVSAGDRAIFIALSLLHGSGGALVFAGYFEALRSAGAAAAYSVEIVAGWVLWIFLTYYWSLCHLFKSGYAWRKKRGAQDASVRPEGVAASR